MMQKDNLKHKTPTEANNVLGYVFVVMSNDEGFNPCFLEAIFNIKSDADLFVKLKYKQMPKGDKISGYVNYSVKKWRVR